MTAEKRAWSILVLCPILSGPVLHGLPTIRKEKKASLARWCGLRVSAMVLLPSSSSAAVMLKDDCNSVFSR